MAGEVLLTASELLDGFPDNSTGLISAVDVRNLVVSATPGVGYIENDPAQVPYTIAMTNGVEVPFMPTLVNPSFVGNFWAMDANNRFIPDYGSVTVPPGALRLVSGTVLLLVQKLGSQEDSYLFQGTADGALTGNPVIETISTEPTTISLSGVRLYDVSAGSAIGFSITPEGTGDDLEILGARLMVESVML